MNPEVLEKINRYRVQLEAALSVLCLATTNYVNGLGGIQAVQDARAAWHILRQEINEKEDLGILFRSDFQIIPFYLMGDESKDAGQFNRTKTKH